MAKLDCMGDFCPLPALKVNAKLASLKPGERLTVLLDHSCAVDNIKELAHGQVSQMEINEVANGVWEITLIKG
ncbi:MAG TPA: sulfurtransferase TusA family protein [Bacillota bacterium]|nr:sulfurtransferase TusA family protein [Bacillota bacterium]